MDYACIVDASGGVHLVVEDGRVFHDGPPLPLGGEEFGVVDVVERAKLQAAFTECLQTGAAECRNAYSWEGRDGFTRCRFFRTDLAVLLVAHDEANLVDMRATVTEHDRDLLARLSNGETVREIAESWGVETGTVSDQRRRIVVKLGCRTSEEAVAYAIRSGLI